MSSPFTAAYAIRADQIFLHPNPEYQWRDIVSGTDVRSQSGPTRRMFAVAPGTFRGFHRMNQQCPGAKEEFISYFRDDQSRLIAMLNEINSQADLHKLSETFCKEIRSRLKNCKPSQLESYNKLRKPVDLYLQHLTCMANELSHLRPRLVPWLHLPLDSQILAHPHIFTPSELSIHRLTRKSTYQDIADPKTYTSLQNIISTKASQLSITLGRQFWPIYFDLTWNNRYERWGGNLFETNPHKISIA